MDIEKIMSIADALSDDAQQLTLTFTRTPLALSAGELDVLIARLGHLREQMKPAVPVDATNVKHAHHAEHCYFRPIQIDGKLRAPVDAGATFLFQSPRYGWFQFQATPEYCKALLPWLQGQGKELSAPSGTPIQ